MIKQILYVFLAAVVCLTAAGCLDTIAFTRPEGQLNEYVVQGKLVKGSPSIASVLITEVFDKSGFVNPRPVSVRSVFVENNEGQSVELKEAGIGVYEALIPTNDPNFMVEEGMSFRMKLQSIVGDQYETDFESLNPVPELTGIDAELIQKEIYDAVADRIFFRPFIRYTIDANLTANPDGTKPLIKWDIQQTYKMTDSPPRGEPKLCYITSNANVSSLKLIDGNESSQNELNDFFLYDAPVSGFYAEGYYAIILQESLSNKAYKYWDQLRQVIDRSGTIFDAPAGNVITNFTPVNEVERDVIGYFYATQQDTMRLFVSPESVGDPNRLCPPPPAPGGGCGDCCDCLRLPGSTLIKPEYWIQ